MPSNTRAQSSPDLLGVALALGGAVLFSAKGIFIKLAYQAGATPDITLALRMVYAVPVYLTILAITLMRSPEHRARLTPKSVAATMLVGCLGYYIASYLDFAGLAYITAQYARLVLLTYPFFTVILGVLFFGDRMKPGLISSLFVSWIGLGFIFGWNLTINPQGIVIGTLLVLAAAIAFALYQHLAKQQMDVVGATLFTAIGSSAAGFAAIIHAAIAKGPLVLTTLSPDLWLIGLGLGIIATILPTFMLNNAIHRVGARVTAAAGTIGPIATIVMAIIILGEPFTLWHLIGTALVLFGAIRFGRAERHHNTTTPIINTAQNT